jgi:uncharacterized delta-60 repeat protein
MTMISLCKQPGTFPVHAIAHATTIADRLRHCLHQSRDALRQRSCGNPARATVALIAGLAAASAAYGKAGDLDPTFGTGGRVFTEIAASYDNPHAVVVQPDSKILVAGGSFHGREYFALVRYEANGALDPTFGGSGKIVTSFLPASADYAQAVALQTDGKIVAAGTSATGGASSFALARYSANGTLDATFGAGGTVTTSFGILDDATAVAILPDGKILAAGQTITASIHREFALARYHPNGSLDATFGSGGKVITAVGTSDDALAAIALQSDGKIVAVGYSSNNNNTDFAIVRFNANGSLDTSFGTGGKVTLAIGSASDIANCVAILSNGKILVAGNSRAGIINRFALARFNANGTLDTSFGVNGKVATTIGTGSASAESLALQPDGKIVAAGYSITNSVESAAVLRYTANGSLDPSFGDGGKATAVFGDYNNTNVAMALQPDGKIVVALENAVTDSNTRFALARFQGDEVTGTVFEFYNTILGHYFITASAPEQISIDNGGSGPGWVRTGESFKSGGVSRACRFYGTPGVGPNSHFYTLEPAECAQVKLDPGWHFESYDYSGTPPGANSVCASGTIPVYRAYNNGFATNDSNHRYTTKIAIYSGMIAAGWSGENIVFCAPV